MIPYATSLAPEAAVMAAPQSLFRERRKRTWVVSAALSGTAGYIDAAGFLLLVGLFPAHVTGELVGVTTALTGGHQVSHPSRFAMIPLFVTALVVAALVSRKRRRAGVSARPALLGLMTGALALCTAAGVLSLLLGVPLHGYLLALCEAGAVSAMAFQNACTRESPANSCPTTVMTGNLTHLVFELVEAVIVRLRPLPTEETHARVLPKSRLRLVATSLASFVTGALLGGYLASLLGAASFAVPMLGALGLWRRIAREAH